jgi:hypothetical protein
MRAQAHAQSRREGSNAEVLESGLRPLFRVELSHDQLYVFQDFIIARTLTPVRVSRCKLAA